MAYRSLLSASEILKMAVHLVEHGSEGLSLRAVALALNVKAPSLYRYFPNKEALEIAVAEEVLNAMVRVLQPTKTVDPAARFREMVDAYLCFTREHAPLYAFLMQNRQPEIYGLPTGKAFWNLLIDGVSGVSGQPDDTAATVATWSFLHGYASLEQAGAFGTSGPEGGLQRGVEALLTAL